MKRAAILAIALTLLTACASDRRTHHSRIDIEAASASRLRCGAEWSFCLAAAKLAADQERR